MRNRRLVLAGLLSICMGAVGQSPSTRANSDACPDTIPSRGKYVNVSYGFQITIPESLVAFWNSASCVKLDAEGCVCMSDHGRIIPLGSKKPEPTRYIEAYAGYAADLDEPTVALEVAKRLTAIREKSRTSDVEIRRRSKIVISGMSGERVVVRYYDLKLRAWFVDEFVEALRSGVEYALYLTTEDRFYDHDRVIFESVVKSFVLTPA